MSGISDLRRLSNIISSAVDRIEDLCDSKGLQFPSLDTPFSRESEAAREIPGVYDATNLITSAAGQLMAIARSPAMMMLDASYKVRALVPYIHDMMLSPVVFPRDGVKDRVGSRRRRILAYTWPFGELYQLVGLRICHSTCMSVFIGCSGDRQTSRYQLEQAR